MKEINLHNICEADYRKYADLDCKFVLSSYNRNLGGSTCMGWRTCKILMKIIIFFVFIVLLQICLWRWTTITNNAALLFLFSFLVLVRCISFVTVFDIVYFINMLILLFSSLIIDSLLNHFCIVILRFSTFSFEEVTLFILQ